MVRNHQSEAKARYLPSLCSTSSSSSSSGSSEDSEFDSDSESDSISQPEFEEGKFLTPTHENPSPSGNDERGSESESELGPEIKKSMNDSVMVRPKRMVVHLINGQEDLKRAKKTDLEDEKGRKTPDDAKKILFPRIFGEEDKIEILNNMIEFTLKREMDPASNMKAFYIFIKDSLKLNFTKAQLLDKVRRLKRKFASNSIKKDPIFSRLHEQNVYELSKQIWWYPETKTNGVVSHEPEVAPNYIPGESKKKKIRIKSHGLTETEEGNVDITRLIRVNGSIGESSLEEDIVRSGLELIDGIKMSQLEGKWKRLRVQQLELYLKRVELICEQTELALEALKASKNEHQP